MKVLIYMASFNTCQKYIFLRNIRSKYFSQLSKTLSSKMDAMIAVTQLTSTSNKDDNFANCSRLVEHAVNRGAQMVFLPEGCDYLAESKKQSVDMAEPLSGPTVNRYCKLAASLGVWLSVGGIHLKEEGDKKINNTHLIINSSGSVVSKYCKTHLFNVHIPERKINLQESTYVQAGQSIVIPVATPCGSVAMGICYDMRFPEFSILQRKMGAQILTFPSAFTVPTGLAHWHALLKARAIESQCYVVAAAQVGQHNSKRSSYGHAVIIDPWGAVISEVSEGVGVAYAEINFAYLEKVRKEMPVFNHRRSDLYSLSYLVEDYGQCRLTEILPFPKSYVSYKFGKVNVPGDCIFLKTLLSQAFTNKKPFTAGHILVTPENPSARYLDLTDVEVTDLAQVVVISHKILLKQHTSKGGVQIAIQDGIHAGQTIQHVHVHLVPLHERHNSMTAGYENSSERKWRDEEDMKEEASSLRHLVTDLQNTDQWLQSSDVPRMLHLEDPLANEKFHIGDEALPMEKIILCSRKAFATLSSNPVLPGHVLICPRRQVSSVADLTPAEVSDLFLCIQKVQKYLEAYYGTYSSTIFLSDGESGSVLKAHILPRNENDIKENDSIYTLLLGHEENPQDKEYDEDLLMFMKKNITHFDY